MMLGNEIRAALPGMQAQAESRMVDTFVAYEPDGWTTDADGFRTPAYTDRGTVQGEVRGDTGPDTDTRTVMIGDTARTVLVGGLRIPVSATVPTAGEYGIGWEYECVAVGQGSDPALLGRRWLVAGVPAKTHATARRLDVAEV